MAYECCKYESIMEQRGTLTKEGYCKIKYPPLGNVYAPWVCMKLQDKNGKTITVGNLSNPPDNRAVIKSFEYSAVDGQSLKFIVEDQQGGELVRFVKHLNTDWKNAASDRRDVIFQFGWVRQGCSFPLPGMRSPCYINKIQSCNVSYSGGKFTIEMIASDSVTIASQGSSEQHFGKEGDETYLRDAIRKLISSGEYPHFKNYRIVDNDDKPCCFEGEKIDREKNIFVNSPKGVFRSECEDKLSIIRRWLFDYASEHQLGWTISWDNINQELIIKEDISDKRSSCVASYIVNGGSNSPVLEFNPKFDWCFDNQTSAQGSTDNQTLSPHDNENKGYSDTADGGSAKGTKASGRYDVPELSRAAQPGAGGITNVAPTENISNQRGKEAAQVTARNNDRNIQAESRIWPNKIEANLVVVGDPMFMEKPWLAGGRTVEIKMVNPFFVNKQNNPFNPNAAYEWLASPAYNSVVQSTRWRIKSVNHRIESGNYTTTLSLHITQPGVDKAPGPL